MTHTEGDRLASLSKWKCPVCGSEKGLTLVDRSCRDCGTCFLEDRPAQAGTGREMSDNEERAMTDKPTIKEAIRMGIDKAAQGPSERAKAWCIENTPNASVWPTCVRAFDAGAAAERERTCEWKWNRELWQWESGCEQRTYEGDRVSDATPPVGPFCEGCGGKIVVAAQDRGSE